MPRPLSPVQVYEETTWEVHDPNTAKTVAVFYDGPLAREYQLFLNRKYLRGEQ